MSWFEFVTIHMTFPCLNAWLTYAFFYQVSDVVLLSCPYLPDPNVQPNWWCTGGGANPHEGGAELYQYTLFLIPADIAYFLIFCENVIYLASYKDVIFGLTVVGEFSAIFYYSKRVTSGSDVKRDKLNKTQNLMIVMIVLNLVCLIFTLVQNFDSAFYTKARQFQKMEEAFEKKRLEQM